MGSHSDPLGAQSALAWGRAKVLESTVGLCFADGGGKREQ